MAASKRSRHGEPAAGLVSCMKQTLTSGEFSDVRFTVGRHFGPVKTFEAHKHILAMRSSVFRAMFYGSLPENCAVPIDIPDFMPDAFANMLSYMYTDEAENLNADNVFHTMNCADKYDVAPLVQICLSMIYSQLDVDNCLFALEQAVQWHADTIVEKCWRLLDEKTEEILRSDHFTCIRQDTLRTILQRDTLSAGEQDIYSAIERWATEACKRNNMEPSAANRRQMLGEALFLVRFPLLTAAQLSDGPATGGLLSETELLSIFLYQNAALKPTLPFPTEQRHTVPMPTGFQLGDAVFVPGPADHWQLAKIVGNRQSKLVIRREDNRREEIVETERVALAANVELTGFYGYASPGERLVFDLSYSY
ncbi:BTB/POZ domain-containing protein 6-A-like isoform X2 [Paramacrobiotus metropolitanus]|nr:BTB/POZ domain-containing protein 6-A-like isoform X2 [Paramacrobiotus metropolitanus]XP_055351473.1 BTB/POZ domain-containing protein 6-A-like isoform X2 [Paramacrobiotus metropolitanus]XP_055351474.1 BTB/POZ domain-containing protein 6-A-like isoform X2 [Paramacrobiotus metropolitanus]